ncbi:MAG: YbaB/EbfC family nucleoid-associated protein [Pseudomonadota bacterium]
MDFGEMMKQAAGLQSKLKEAQDRIAAMEVEGSSGGGMVRIVVNGVGHCKAVAIERSLLKEGDGDVLEDLIAAAINDAREKQERQSKEEMKSLTDGLPLPPGMKLPF